MRKLIAFLAISATGLVSQTTHDAPLELFNGSFHAVFRADTFIDPQIARTAFNFGQNQLAQHTHAFAHSVRILRPGQKVQSVAMKPTDGLMFRLRGRRTGRILGYVSVTPEMRDGIGGLVAGHVAQTPIPAGKRALPNSSEGAKAMVAKMPAADQHSANLIWVVSAPAGFTWLEDGVSATDIKQAIQDSLRQSNHTLARNAAMSGKKPKYKLRDGSLASDFTADAVFVVPSEGVRSGRGIPLPPGTHVIVCENINGVPSCVAN